MARVERARGRVKLPGFAYHAPTTVAEATELLAEHGIDAAVLAGGQSLLPALALRIAQPEHLVDVNRVDELATVSRHNGTVGVGALVRQQQALASFELRDAVPLLAEALPHVGYRETRSRGTVVGSLAHADPAAELPAVAIALEGEIVLRSIDGERVVASEEFFIAPFMTAKGVGELAVELRLPVTPPGAGCAFLELERGPFALVAVAAQLELDADGAVAEARLAFAGVDGVPVRGRAGEDALRGRMPDEPALAEAAEVSIAELEPPSDVLASAAYRRRVARELAKDALQQAAARAGGGDA